MNWKPVITLLLNKILNRKDMKLSNKLLTGFASALVLIPLLGMVYVSQAYYKIGTYNDDRVDRVASEQHFNTPTENMESKPIATPFQSINIEDAKQLGLYINFIKDENYGIKIPNELKGAINFTVDATGKLQFVFDNKKVDPKSTRYTTIYVYGKEMKQVNVSNADFMYFDAKGDSIQLNMKKSGSLTLNKDITLSSLQITTDEVKEVSINEVAVKSLSVTLNGANFRSNESSYDNLSITAAGKSEIEIKGSDYENGKNYLIKNLFVNTLNEVDFKLENIKIDKCSGSFSDQTKVQMPAVNLNQMYKR